MGRRGKKKILLKEEEDDDNGGGADYERMKTKRDQDIIRKGPWKAEEDQVLLHHVNKQGPREWSSIRSKGLLQRTGKSCRLRWVNKLRPDLKNGCKFSEEEQRVVIELQARFGNKWARIATHLPGRTDNDVKNFWSSRQKRLARILLPNTSGKECPAPPAPTMCVPLGEAAIVAALEEESTPNTAAVHSSSSSSCAEPTKTLSLPVMRHPQPPELVSFSPESKELLAGLEDPYFFFGGTDVGELPLGQPLPLPWPLPGGIDDDDFPADLFGHIDGLPSPSHW